MSLAGGGFDDDAEIVDITVIGAGPVGLSVATMRLQPGYSTNTGVPAPGQQAA